MIRDDGENVCRPRGNRRCDPHAVFNSTSLIEWFFIAANRADKDERLQIISVCEYENNNDAGGFFSGCLHSKRWSGRCNCERMDADGQLFTFAGYVLIENMFSLFFFSIASQIAICCAFCTSFRKWKAHGWTKRRAECNANQHCVNWCAHLCSSWTCKTLVDSSFKTKSESFCLHCTKIVMFCVCLPTPFFFPSPHRGNYIHFEQVDG